MGAEIRKAPTSGNWSRLARFSSWYSPAGSVTRLFSLGTRGLAVQGLRLGNVKVGGQSGRARAGGHGSLVLRAGLDGDGAQRFQPAHPGLLFLGGAVQRRRLGRAGRDRRGPGAVAGRGPFDRWRGGFQLGLTAQRVEAAALAVGEPLGRSLRDQRGFQAGLAGTGESGGGVALSRGHRREGRGPGRLPGIRRRPAAGLVQCGERPGQPQ